MPPKNERPIKNRRRKPDATQRPDPHSFYVPGQPRIKHLTWFVTPNFEARRLEATTELTFTRWGRYVDLDTRDLEILEVRTHIGQTGRKLRWELGPTDEIRGKRLRIFLPNGLRRITINYRTSPDATGLQWLTTEQTGGSHPFCYSQGEMVNTRSFLPCQDTPCVRFTYEAYIYPHRPLTCVMAAIGGPNHWKMERPIPSYLVAFAIGELEHATIGPRSSVWASPQMVREAQLEFEGIEGAIKQAEKIFGPYRWGRFSILVMPPAFPYGGMENPGLTFVSPSIVAGDGSGRNVAWHELMHHWFGNYVTNARWSDFWLNEGWTMWGQFRLTEAILGRTAALLDLALYQNDFDRDRANFERRGQEHLVCLEPNLDGMNPDDSFSMIPYHMGHLFLREVERLAGRRAMERFARAYIKRFAFQSITTEQFMRFLKRKLPKVAAQMDLKAWRRVPGLPAGTRKVVSRRAHEIKRMAEGGTIMPPNWSPREICYYLECLPEGEVGRGLCNELETRYGFSAATNLEIRATFLTVAVKLGFEYVYNRAAGLLAQIGRMKYLRPMYQALHTNPATRDRARHEFERLRPTYQHHAASAIERVLAA